MSSLARSPPVVGLALSAGSGAIFTHLGVPLLWALISPLLLPLLNRLFKRPCKHLPTLILAFLAGAGLMHSWRGNVSQDCRFRLQEGEELQTSGRLVGPLILGKGELHLDASGPKDCRERIRMVVPGVSEGEWEAGTPLGVRGIWKRSSIKGRVSPLWAGYLRVDSMEVLPPSISDTLGGGLVAVGGWVQNRLKYFFPETASLAVALVWARKDGLDPSVREAFSRAGVAHLLAISGFHVGVVAGVLLLVFGSLGLPHPLRFFFSSVGVWAYVLAIGVPDAALRAALILTIFASGRIANRAVAPLGALATAFLGFLVIDTGALLRPGFQLSFTGALGLILGYRPLFLWLSARGGKWIPSLIYQGTAAGVAATLTTLPLVAWHFGRISFIGIPLTLVGAPLVALAIPGVFLCLLLSLVNLGLAGLIAPGVDLVLRLFVWVVGMGAGLPFASAWVSHATVVSGTGALGLAALLLVLGVRSGKPKRNRTLTYAVVTGLLLGPPLSRLVRLGVLELVVLDVGQGDAALLRSPRGRWVLVDAGPRTRSFDAGERTILPYLRKRGVSALDLLILTHPDMDHVGGAPSVLAEFPVGAVADPGLPTGTEVFLETLEAARERGVPWRVLHAGDSLNLDGMALRVLAPEPQGLEPLEDGKNSASLVLEIRFGSFCALLTGDATAGSEERFIRRILSPRIDVLKVGHHGSSTSTTETLLDRTKPETAIISVGRRNRFGHPTPEVLRRLSQRGTKLYRTDELGAITLRARKNGSYGVSTQHRWPGDSARIRWGRGMLLPLSQGGI